MIITKRRGYHPASTSFFVMLFVISNNIHRRPRPSCLSIRCMKGARRMRNLVSRRQ
ncbi:MAG: BC10 family protein [Prevotella sp.]|nr:BC10 family protein [Prevotella sp.]MBQ8629227.1 BC10 family protein [Prevotella sp.]